MIVNELLPVLNKRYNLSSNPDDHAIGGASSGAIAAFTVAWHRPDQFRKVLSTIGSFTNIRGGHVYPDLIRERRAETDPDLSAGRPERQSRAAWRRADAKYSRIGTGTRRTSRWWPR